MDKFDIRQLSTLLGSIEEEFESGYVTRCGGAPDADAASRVVVRSGAELKPAAPADPPTPTAIWDPEEVPEGAELDDVDDPRPQPEYTIHFRQRVGAEDVFLQMGQKTPATASCEDLVVRVQLPGESRASHTVDVTRRRLDVRGSRWRLGLFLPHPVREREAHAVWDEKKEELEVVVPASRDLDALNF